MKKITKLKKWWRSETPFFARVLQSFSAGVGALPLYYSSLPERFQLAMPDNYVLIISLTGFFTTFLLNFSHKAEK